MNTLERRQTMQSFGCKANVDGEATVLVFDGLAFN
jgi:hypothetical protein